jgi:hypothetical protein
MLASDCSVDMANTSENMAKVASVRIDSESFEMTDENASKIQEAFDKAVAAAKSAGETASAELQAKLTESETARKAAQKNALLLKLRLDAEAAAAVDAEKKEMLCDLCAGNGKVDGAVCDMCDGKGKMGDDEGDDDEEECMDCAAPADVEAEAKAAHLDWSEKNAARAEKVRARKDAKAKSKAEKITAYTNLRAALMSEAAKHLGEDVKLDELSNHGIRRAVLAKLAPKALEKISNEFVKERYQEAIETAADQPSGSQMLNAAMKQQVVVVSDSESDDPQVARQKMIGRMHNAWKLPADK